MALKNASQYYSCKRRRDYITILAVGLFLLMLLAQFYLVLVLPVRLQEQESLEYNVTSQRLLRNFDRMRSCLKNLHPDGSIAKGEADMLRGTFEQLQLYVRENKDAMTLQQMVQTNRMNRMLESVYNRCSVNKYHIRQEELVQSSYFRDLENLIREEESKAFRP